MSGTKLHFRFNAQKRKKRGGEGRIYAFFLRDDRKALRAQIFETQNYANAYKAQKLKVIYQL